MVRTHLPEAVGCFLGGRGRIIIRTRHGSRRCLGRQSRRWGFPGQTPASCTEGTGEGSHGGCRGPPFLPALWDQHPGTGEQAWGQCQLQLWTHRLLQCPPHTWCHPNTPGGSGARRESPGAAQWVLTSQGLAQHWELLGKGPWQGQGMCRPRNSRPDIPT